MGHRPVGVGVGGERRPLGSVKDDADVGGGVDVAKTTVRLLLHLDGGEAEAARKDADGRGRIVSCRRDEVDERANLGVHPGGGGWDRWRASC